MWRNPGAPYGSAGPIENPTLPGGVFRLRRPEHHHAETPGGKPRNSRRLNAETTGG